MATVKENLRNFRELDSCEQSIFIDYLFGRPIAVLEEIHSPKTGEASYKIKKLFKKEKLFSKTPSEQK